MLEAQRPLDSSLPQTCREGISEFNQYCNQLCHNRLISLFAAPFQVTANVSCAFFYAAVGTASLPASLPGLPQSFRESVTQFRRGCFSVGADAIDHTARACLNCIPLIGPSFGKILDTQTQLIRCQDRLIDSQEHSNEEQGATILSLSTLTQLQKEELERLDKSRQEFAEACMQKADQCVAERTKGFEEQLRNLDETIRKQEEGRRLSLTKAFEAKLTDSSSRIAAVTGRLAASDDMRAFYEKSTTRLTAENKELSTKITSLEDQLFKRNRRLASLRPRKDGKVIKHGQ